jgi:hypothetical protein
MVKHGKGAHKLYFSYCLSSREFMLNWKFEQASVYVSQLNWLPNSHLLFTGLNIGMLLGDIYTYFNDVM